METTATSTATSTSTLPIYQLHPHSPSARPTTTTTSLHPPSTNYKDVSPKSPPQPLHLRSQSLSVRRL
jgi:hypothetical protein